eukprot:Partr_v1_DN26644_c1_g1_i2_m69260 putative TBC1 domain family member
MDMLDPPPLSIPLHPSAAALEPGKRNSSDAPSPSEITDNISTGNDNVEITMVKEDEEDDFETPMTSPDPHVIAALLARGIPAAVPIVVAQNIQVDPLLEESLEADHQPDIVVIPRLEDLKGSDQVDEYGFFSNDRRLTGTNQSGRSSRVDLKHHDRDVRRYRKLESRWVDIVQNWDEFLRHNPQEVKLLCRKGIPLSLRGRVWSLLAGVSAIRKEGVYDELLTRPKPEIHEVIERDINRCYPDHFFFRDKDTIGQRHLFDILKAYAHFNPLVGYCQGMGRLVGLMLMQLPAEETFWLLVATLEKYLKDYYTPSMDRFRIHSLIFEKLLRLYAPTLHKHLTKNDVTPLIYITNWFLTVYTMVLPWETVLRVWDMFYCEGIKVLFRIGLGIMLKCKEHILKNCPTSTEIMTFLLHIPEDFLGLDLIDIALSINLGRRSIDRLEEEATRLWQNTEAPDRADLSLVKSSNSTKATAKTMTNRNNRKNK